ncbi:hypothetical protein C8D88_1011861 [Lentzea atacamensis]|uniref:Secreted protein n=2 Tax=Lentzea TaxID=165301 RepID=A0A316IEH0_9PSEU|nr:hypothetical protein [Lentzea atacamensis]PWK91822.1 hypothetical protein C8D88_1011861 [Lentzea atacamensis]
MRRRVVVAVAAGAIVIGGVGGAAAVAASDSEPTNKVVTAKGGGPGVYVGVVTAKCPEGFQVTGGGIKADAGFAPIRSSYPEPDLSGWTVEEERTAQSPTHDPYAPFEVYAVCTPLPA